MNTLNNQCDAIFFYPFLLLWMVKKKIDNEKRRA
jgi:hypothetical protein